MKPIQRKMLHFWKNWGHRNLILLEFYHKFSKFFLNDLILWPCSNSPPFLNNRLSIIVLVWDVADKFICLLMHAYSISKQIINIINNITTVKLFCVVIWLQEMGSKVCPVLLVTSEVISRQKYQKNLDNSLKNDPYE